MDNQIEIDRKAAAYKNAPPAVINKGSNLPTKQEQEARARLLSPRYSPTVKGYKPIEISPEELSGDPADIVPITTNSAMLAESTDKLLTTQYQFEQWMKTINTSNPEEIKTLINQVQNGLLSLGAEDEPLKIYYLTALAKAIYKISGSELEHLKAGKFKSNYIRQELTFLQKGWDFMLKQPKTTPEIKETIEGYKKTAQEIFRTIDY